MKEELCLLHYPDSNPKNWGVFNESDCPDPFGFPDYLYRKYEFDKVQGKKVFEILIEIKDKLVELAILPSPENENIIFPTIDEVSNWDIEMKKRVFSRIESIFKD